jgi:hypothetical protein
VPKKKPPVVGKAKTGTNGKDPFYIALDPSTPPFPVVDLSAPKGQVFINGKSVAVQSLSKGFDMSHTPFEQITAAVTGEGLAELQGASMATMSEALGALIDKAMAEHSPKGNFWDKATGAPADPIKDFHAAIDMIAKHGPSAQVSQVTDLGVEVSPVPFTMAGSSYTSFKPGYQTWKAEVYATMMATKPVSHIKLVGITEESGPGAKPPLFDPFENAKAAHGLLQMNPSPWEGSKYLGDPPSHAHALEFKLAHEVGLPSPVGFELGHILVGTKDGGLHMREVNGWKKLGVPNDILCVKTPSQTFVRPVAGGAWKEEGGVEPMNDPSKIMPTASVGTKVLTKDGKEWSLGVMKDGLTWMHTATFALDKNGGLKKGKDGKLIRSEATGPLKTIPHAQYAKGGTIKGGPATVTMIGKDGKKQVVGELVDVKFEIANTVPEQAGTLSAYLKKLIDENPGLSVPPGSSGVVPLTYAEAQQLSKKVKGGKKLTKAEQDKLVKALHENGIEEGHWKADVAKLAEQMKADVAKSFGAGVIGSMDLSHGSISVDNIDASFSEQVFAYMDKLAKSPVPTELDIQNSTWEEVAANHVAGFYPVNLSLEDLQKVWEAGQPKPKKFATMGVKESDVKPEVNVTIPVNECPNGCGGWADGHTAWMKEGDRLTCYACDGDWEARPEDLFSPGLILAEVW